MSAEKPEPGPDGFFRHTAWQQEVANPLKLAADAEAKEKPLPIRQPQFNCPPGEMQCIQAIAARACEMLKVYGILGNPVKIAMDVAVVHCNVTPLRLEALLMCDQADFQHDIGGIYKHLDRQHLVLLNGWKPLFGVVKS